MSLYLNNAPNIPEDWQPSCNLYLVPKPSSTKDDKNNIYYYDIEIFMHCNFNKKSVSYLYVIHYLGEQKNADLEHRHK